MHQKIVAVVGMPGSGKTEACRFLERIGFKRIRFGDITDKYLKDNNLEPTEENARRAREFLRMKEGMGAYAKLSLPEIQRELNRGNVVIDGLYSWEEYKFLKGRFDDNLHLLAIYSPPKVRYLRLNNRLERPLSKVEVISRDIAEIENLNKGGPIAMAEHTIVNIHTLKELRNEVVDFVKGF